MSTITTITLPCPASLVVMDLYTLIYCWKKEAENDRLHQLMPLLLPHCTAPFPVSCLSVLTFHSLTARLFPDAAAAIHHCSFPCTSTHFHRHYGTASCCSRRDSSTTSQLGKEGVHRLNYEVMVLSWRGTLYVLSAGDNKIYHVNKN